MYTLGTRCFQYNSGVLLILLLVQYILDSASPHLFIFIHATCHILSLSHKRLQQCSINTASIEPPSLYIDWVSQNRVQRASHIPRITEVYKKGADVYQFCIVRIVKP